MDRLYEKNAVLPGQDGFEYDVRVYNFNLEEF